jgi:hypothetical protein
MRAEPNFVCAQCGTTHEGLPTDQGYKLPDDVYAIPKSEREARATFTSDLFSTGERYFFPGLAQGLLRLGG